MKREQQKALVLAIVHVLREHARSGTPDGPGTAWMTWGAIWERMRRDHGGVTLMFQQQPINVVATPTFADALAKWSLDHAEVLWRFLPVGWKFSRFDREGIEVTFP